MTAPDAITGRTLEFNDIDRARELFGPHEQHLEAVSSTTGVQINSRGTSVFLYSQDSQALTWAADTLKQLDEHLQAGHSVTIHDVRSALTVLEQDPGAEIGELFDDELCCVAGKKTICPRTPGQKRYLQAVRSHDLTFAIGPAGTGKTYLAMAIAVESLLTRKTKRIILTRPAVEAGEKLGFLPGDMVEKVNPYLRPLYDALHDMLGAGRVQEMVTEGIIEIAPLAFMRGRTLSNAVIILDEAQNTTPEQMKMFLTRLGFGSRVIVTGDITQIDLPGNTVSGLTVAERILGKVEGISFTVLNETDVVRHPLVSKIVRAYAHYDKKNEKN